MVVCPEDKARINWQDDPRELFDNGAWEPAQPTPSAPNKRWPYSSSYVVTVSSFDKYQSSSIRSYPGPWVTNRIQQYARNFNQFSVTGSANLGNLKIADVTFPSAKVHMYDEFARHFGKFQYFYLDPDAREPLLMFDGSGNVSRTGDSNLGWTPRNPPVPDYLINYNPDPEDAWYPLPRNQGGDVWPAVYNYTRGGLNGYDFGGEPLDTGQK